MNIAGRIFDAYDDPNASPSLDVEGLKDSDFALIMKTANRTIRKYPLMDKTSSVYFEAAKSWLHPEIAKVASSGFTGGANVIDITKLADKAPVTVSHNGYPLHNENHVKTAMDRFSYTSQKMDPYEKYAYANAIATESMKYSLELQGDILNYLHKGINKEAVAYGVTVRNRHLLNDSLKETLSKLAESPTPQKFVEFDKLAGLDVYVRDNKIPDGYATCFAWTKTAATDIDRIKNIPLQVIEQLFDPGFAKEWSKDPVAVYNSLPMPTKAMIDKQEGCYTDKSASFWDIATGAVTAGAAYEGGKNRGAQNLIDIQFKAKGWFKSDDKRYLYEKNENRIVSRYGKYMVIDKDGDIKREEKSLAKLVLEV